METTLEHGSRFGPFTILRLLGRGGMGSVYRVRWEEKGTEGALKLIRPGQKPEALRRFRREIDATAKLSHPGIVRVLDFGVIDDAPYYVMEPIDSPTLETLLENAAAGGRAVMELAAFGALFTSLLDALGHAHARRVIHRDIKPSNVFVTPQNQAILVDFGLAFVEDQTALTASGATVGTPTHMAPEQIRGGTVDARTDLYQVSLLMYQTLTGSLPFADQEGAFGIALARMTRPIPPPSVANPTVPPQLDRVILRGLSVRASDRHADAAAMAKDLQAAIERREVAPVTLATRDDQLDALRGKTASTRVKPAPEKPKGSIARMLLLAAVVNTVGFGGLYVSLRQNSTSIGEVRVEPGVTDATISFTTAVPAAAVVEFGTGESPDRLARAKEPGLSHRVRLEGLAPGQDHVFRLVAELPDGRRHSGQLLRFRTQPASGVPATGGAVDVKVRSGSRELEIRFRTQEPARSRLLLNGPDGSRELPVSGSPAVEHHLLVKDLAPSTRYGFRIVLAADAGPPLTSLEQSIETSAEQ